MLLKQSRLGGVGGRVCLLSCASVFPPCQPPTLFSGSGMEEKQQVARSANYQELSAAGSHCT